MNVAELIAFEKGIAADFEAGIIAAPVHLAAGNEQLLIDVFSEIDKDNDWVCCAWRSHLHCLLKGVPPEKLRKAIHDGRSIALAFPEHKVICSAIVGGIAPIAMGIAWALKKQGKKGKVWTFLGDMTATTGIFHETKRYASGHALPIEFIIEDNGQSVCTDTQEVWGDHNAITVQRYDYKMTVPHVGTGRWVRF